MKRLMHILTALTLTFLVVLTSAGVSLMHCMHSGDVRVAQINASGLSDKHCECAENKGCDCSEEDCASDDDDCKQVEIVQLSPTTMAQSLSFDFTPHALPIAFFEVAIDNWQAVVCPKTSPDDAFADICFPPRVRLNKIRVLLI